MPHGTIKLDPVSNPAANAAFTITGTLTITPSDTYADDGGAAHPVTVADLTFPLSINHPGLPAGTHSVVVSDAVSGASATAAVTVGGAAPVFIGANQSFTDAAGNVFRIDGQENAYETPKGHTEVPLGNYGDLGWNAKEMGNVNGVIYIQDARDNTWHTFNGAMFSAAVAAPPGAPGNPPPPPPGAQPPPQAVAAGYTHPALLSEFTSASEVTANNPRGSAVWSTALNDGFGQLQPGDWDVTNSILTIHTGTNEAAAGLTTGQSRNSVISTPGNIKTNAGDGVLYQYGYFEASIKFDPTTVLDVNQANGQPAWWAIGDVAGIADGNDHGELDFMECFANDENSPFGGALRCGPINWYGTNSGFTPIDPNQGFGPNYCVSGGTGLEGSVTNATLTSSGVDPHDFNIYGCLWTPTQVTMYWNSATRRANGIADTVVQSVSTVKPVSGSRDFTGDTSAGAAGQKPPLTYDGMNTAAAAGGAMCLILAAGDHTPIQVDYVRVWQ